MFVWKTFLAQRQVVRAPGFFGGRLLLDAHRTVLDLDCVGKRAGHEGVSRSHTPRQSHATSCRMV